MQNRQVWQKRGDQDDFSGFALGEFPTSQYLS